MKPDHTLVASKVTPCAAAPVDVPGTPLAAVPPELVFVTVPVAAPFGPVKVVVELSDPGPGEVEDDAAELVAATKPIVLQICCAMPPSSVERLAYGHRGRSHGFQLTFKICL
jgi:hypothetical protein